MKTSTIIFALTFISSVALAQAQVSKVGTVAGGSGGGAAAASYAATGKAVISSDSSKHSKNNNGKQTQGATFGEKVNQGLHNAGSVAANGAAKTDNPLYNGNNSSQENPLHKSNAKTANPGTPIGGIIVKGGKN